MGRQGRRRHLLRAWAIAAAILAVGVALPTTASAFPWNETPFCEGQPVAGFLKQLERLPDLHEPDEFERLGPWAPGSVYLSGAAPIQTGPTSVGWALRYGILPRRLDWLVSVEMTRVSLKGTPVGGTQTKQVKIGRPGRNAFTDLSFSVPDDPAIYKVEIFFRNAGGRLLGRFGKYFRVMEPRSNVRLKLTSTSYKPGERIYARVENLGTEQVSYGVPYSIQVFDGTTWMRAPQSPAGPWIMPLWLSAPGRSGSCNSFGIPADMPVGRYRFVKPLDSPRTTITAEFDLTS
jgi:Bacterial Ig-like domain